MGIIDLGKVRPDIIDTLTSDDATNALSARQGKVLKMMVDEKQDKLTVDSIPVSGSANPVSSGGVFSAMLTKAQVLYSDDTAANAKALLLAKVSHVTDKPDGCYLIYGGWSGTSYGVSLIEKANNGNAYVVVFFAGATAYQAYIYNNSGVLTIGVATQFTVTNL